MNRSSRLKIPVFSQSGGIFELGKVQGEDKISLSWVKYFFYCKNIAGTSTPPPFLFYQSKSSFFFLLSRKSFGLMGRFGHLFPQSFCNSVPTACLNGFLQTSAGHAELSLI